MNRPDLKQSLCSRFCSYYNSSKSEPIACRAFLLLERFFKNGRKFNFDMPICELNGNGREFISVICVDCQFYENDCDFIRHAGKAKPCGGYVFIEASIAAGAITLDDIKSN
jgi:hypothetical protein